MKVKEKENIKKKSIQQKYVKRKKLFRKKQIKRRICKKEKLKACYLKLNYQRILTSFISFIETNEYLLHPLVSESISFSQRNS